MDNQIDYPFLLTFNYCWEREIKEKELLLHPQIFKQKRQ